MELLDISLPSRQMSNDAEAVALEAVVTGETVNQPAGQLPRKKATIRIIDIGLQINDTDDRVIYEDLFEEIDQDGKSGQPLPIQTPKTARIFLCPNETLAKDVFQNLGEDEGTWKRKYHPPYCLLDLASWIQPTVGKFTSFGLREMLEPPAEKGLMQVLEHRMYLRKETDDSYIVVWYLSEEFISPGAAIECSIYQASFATQLRSSALVELYPKASLQSFPALFALCILQLDCDWFYHHERDDLFRSVDILPGATCVPVDILEYTNILEDALYQCRSYVNDLTKTRFEHLNLVQRLAEKAEDLNDCTKFQLFEEMIRQSYESAMEFKQEGWENLQFRCSQALTCANRMKKWEKSIRERDLYLTQEKSVRTTFALGVVAPLFLPVALAAAIMSMQFRVRDLTQQLKDLVPLSFLLFGVGVAISALSQLSFAEGRQQFLKKLTTKGYVKRWAIMLTLIGAWLLFCGVLLPWGSGIALVILGICLVCPSVVTYTVYIGTHAT